MDIARHSLRDDERWFVDEITSLLAPWGLPPSSGRVYGYLLLCQASVSVDQIAAALEMSRAGAWNAARLLERFGHVSRYGSLGSKRALYAASDNFAAPFLEQAVLLGNIGNLLQTCASTIAAGQAAKRLEDRARFWLSVRNAMGKAIEQFAPQWGSRTESMLAKSTHEARGEAPRRNNRGRKTAKMR